MVEAGIRVDNLKSFTRKAAQTADGVTALKESMQRIGEFVIARARPATPVKTGRLVGSYRAARTRGSASVTSRVPYADARHWGFRSPRSAKIRFTPFLWNSVVQNRPEIEALVEAELAQIARRFDV